MVYPIKIRFKIIFLFRFLILFFLGVSSVLSEELKLQESQINFIAIHPFKTVYGKCSGTIVSPMIKSVASIRKEGQETVLSGKFQVLMSDFDVERPSLLFATAKDEVSIEYKFILKP